LDYLELSLTVRPEAAEAAADIMRRYAPSGVSIDVPFEAPNEEGAVALGDAPVLLRAWTLPAARSEVDALRRELRALGPAVVRPLRARRVAGERWAEAWKRHFGVLHIGRRIVVRPSWRSYRPRKDAAVIELDPGIAFGTGQHATTRLCLEALEQRIEPRAVVLDIGSGSGILAIAAARLGAARVDAIDVDPAAVSAAKENAKRNGVSRIVRVAQGSLARDWPFAERPRGHYDIVLANLNSRLVQDLARPVVAALRPRGVALLSGLIDDQARACRRALRDAGARIVESRSEDGWTLIVAARAATARSPAASRARGRPRRRAR
jgi:ribosomal protein L11 methyltransferase